MTDTQQLWRYLEEVPDPEIPVLNVVEMGIVRDVSFTSEGVSVAITPTYSGCPAMEAIENDIKKQLGERNLGSVEVETRYAPAWTTDWMTDDAKDKMRDFGISPPGKTCANPLMDPNAHPGCPYCDSRQTTLKSSFGSTACKALHYCHNCHQPFEHFKCI